MPEIEILPQKIVDMRTLILKSKFDSCKVKVQGEKLKTDFFVRFGFFKPKPKDVLLIAFSKYYEPYIVIGGKYSIDYCKRHNFALKIEDRTQAVFIDGKKLKLEPLYARGDDRVIKLVGEEHSHYENETYVILDRMLQEVSAENLFLSPSESEWENQGSDALDLRKLEISLEEEIAILRFKIAKRPEDLAEIIRENFEINERTIIYSPVYELTYKNLKNGKKVTVTINGITGGVVIGNFKKASVKLNLEVTEVSSTKLTRFFRDEPQHRRKLQDYEYAHDSNSAGTSPHRNLVVEERADNFTPRQYQREDYFQLSNEETKNLANNLMRRLGCKEDQFSAHVSLGRKNNIVKIKLQEGFTKPARMNMDNDRR